MTDNRVFEVPKDGIEPKQVRFIDPETDPQFRKSTFPPNNSEIIIKKNRDTTLLSQFFAALCVVVIILLLLVWLENY